MISTTSFNWGAAHVKATLTNNTIYGNDWGVLADESFFTWYADFSKDITLTGTGNTIRNNTLFGVLLEAGAKVSGTVNLDGNLIYSNGVGFQENGVANAHSTCTWWGDYSGPLNATFNPSGLGNSNNFDAAADFEAWAANNTLAPITWYADADSDGYGDLASPLSQCGPPFPSGYVANSTDCNDSAFGINPGVSDTTCNNVDENCSGTADEGYVSVPTTCGVGACASTGSTSCVAGSVVDRLCPQRGGNRGLRERHGRRLRRIH